MVQATLAAAGIAFDYDPLDSIPNQPLGSKVKHLNAWGQLPILELPDGTHLSEVAAILAYLSWSERTIKNGPNLWVDDHPAFLKWSVFLAVNVYEGILRQSYTGRFVRRFADEPGGLSADLPDDIDERVASNIRLAASDRVHAAFQCIERETSEHEFLLGDRLSACDIFLAMLYAWHTQAPILPKCNHITTQVATHAVIRPIWKQNFHDRMDFEWHKL